MEDPMSPDDHRAAMIRWRAFVADEQLEDMAPLARAPIKGWIKAVFWILRVYVVALLILVGIGLYRQS